MPMGMINTFFRLVGKAMRMAVNRPIQRFNIFSRVKKHLGEDAKYFMPAPRAIGAQSLRIGKPQQYPHLEGRSGFKSIKQRRIEAIAERNEKLLARPSDSAAVVAAKTNDHRNDGLMDHHKSFSETIKDDDLVISTSSKLPVIKTVTRINPPASTVEGTEAAQQSGELVAQEKPKRPLPTSTNLQLSDPAVIWQVDKVPPGRLDLNKLQELMINKLADDAYWTPKQISETYNIKEEYAENITTYLKQIRIIVSPRMGKVLDYVARNDPIYQSTKHIVYHVDKSLRSEFDKLYDGTFLPTDELDPEVREVLDAGAVTSRQEAISRLGKLIRRPEPLKLKSSEPSGGASEEPQQVIETMESSQVKPKRTRKRLASPLNLKRPTNEEESDGAAKITQDNR